MPNHLSFRTQLKSFSFWLSVLALSVSALTVCDHFQSDTKVLMGKQLRLFVVSNYHDTDIAQPTIMTSISCFNTGGKAQAVMDTKLKVRLVSNGITQVTADFVSVRRVDNFLLAVGDFKEQHPVTPMLVLGKSAAVAQYCFWPAEPLSQDRIPETFDLEVDLLVSWGDDEWELEKTYVARDVRRIWQDIETAGPTYRAAMVEVQSL